MKKKYLILLFVASQLLINCSSNSSDSVTPSATTDPTFSMNVSNVLYTGTNLSSGGCKWNKQTNTDGTHVYFLEIMCAKATDNNVHIAHFYLNTENIIANQVIPVSVSTFHTFFAIDNYYNVANSTGQVKITSFDGTKMSGEFSFTNLYSNGNTTTQPVTVTNGIFNNIPNHN